MHPPAPVVQISPAVAQEVIALQAAELVRLRTDLGNGRVRCIMLPVFLLRLIQCS